MTGAPLTPGAGWWCGEQRHDAHRLRVIELYRSVRIEDPKDPSTWTVRDGRHRRPPTATEVEAMRDATRDVIDQAKQLRAIEREMCAVYRDLRRDEDR